MSMYPFCIMDEARAREDLVCLTVPIGGLKNWFLLGDAYCINPDCDCDSQSQQYCF